MKNVLVGIVFLFGMSLGLLTATQIGEELIHKIPAKYLTFGRPDDIQAAAKIYNGVPPENGKLVYIMGGSSGFTSANEQSLSNQLTERLGVPVTVYNVSAASQKMIESYSMIGKMPETTQKEQVYVVMTYGGYRASSAPVSSVRSAFSRLRSLLRHDAIRDLIENENLLEESFMLNPKGKAQDPKEFMASLDKKHTSSVGSEKVLERVKRVFAHPNHQKRIQARYDRYTNNLTSNYERLNPETIKKRQDFALYSIKKSKELSNQKNYSFTALELPIHKSLHSKPLIYDYRTSFNQKLIALAKNNNFPIFYLDEYISEMEPKNRWNDTGHMSVLGRYTYEKYYVDVLTRFINGDEDGVYGDKTLPPNSKSLELQD